MKSNILKPLMAIAGSCALFAGSAQAAVVTSGCASATSCTLAELYAGGSITANGVEFGSWALNFDDSDNPIDASAVTVTGLEGMGSASLAFAFDPMLAVEDGEFIEYDFDFVASIIGGSMANIVGAALEIADGAIGADGGFDFFEVNAGLPSIAEVLSLDESGIDSTTSMFSVLSLLADFDFQAEADDGGFAFLSGFVYSIALSEDVSDVPVPGAFLLMLTALGAGGAMRRKSKAVRA